jgi:hypothetical protein
MVAM